MCLCLCVTVDKRLDAYIRIGYGFSASGWNSCCKSIDEVLMASGCGLSFRTRQIEQSTHTAPSRSGQIQHTWLASRPHTMREESLILANFRETIRWHVIPDEKFGPFGAARMAACGMPSKVVCVRKIISHRLSELETSCPHATTARQHNCKVARVRGAAWKKRVGIWDGGGDEKRSRSKVCEWGLVDVGVMRAAKEGDDTEVFAKFCQGSLLCGVGVGVAHGRD